jgi:ParB family transcriptional regulator, chromosome partitioning protein
LEIRVGGRRQNAASQIEDLPVGEILANPYQNRSVTDADTLQELAESIRAHGILQPILVRKKESKYYLVSGERRIRAAKIIGLEKVPAVVKEMSDVEAAAATLVENLQRENVSFLDEAAGFHKLNSEFEITQVEIARLVGKSQSYIANKIRLLNLPDKVRDIISREIMITERHCRALLRLPDEDMQISLLKEIISKKMNTEQTDARVGKIVKDGEWKPRQRKKMVIRDIRIFLNSINTAIDALRESGIETEWAQSEEDDYIEYHIKIKK